MTLVVGLLPVLAARALFAGLSRLSWSAWQAVGDLARWPPPDAPLLGLLRGFTPLGVLGAAALVLLLLRCSPGGAGARAARAARGPVAPDGAARRSPAGRLLGPPAPFAKGVVRPGQAPQLPALRGASLPGLTPSSSFAPAGYLTLTEAAAAFGVGRQRLLAAVRRGALPAQRAGWGRTSPWVLRAPDVAGYLAPRPDHAEHRPGRPGAPRAPRAPGRRRPRRCWSAGTGQRRTGTVGRPGPGQARRGAVAGDRLLGRPPGRSRSASSVCPLIVRSVAAARGLRAIPVVRRRDRCGRAKLHTNRSCVPAAGQCEAGAEDAACQRLLGVTSGRRRCWGSDGAPWSRNGPDSAPSRRGDDARGQSSSGADLRPRLRSAHRATGRARWTGFCPPTGPPPARRVRLTPAPRPVPDSTPATTAGGERERLRPLGILILPPDGYK